MRSLNLSRLARASEGSFFKDKQIEQTQKLRQSLPSSAVSSAPTKQSEPTVDTLASISAQSAYRKLILQSPPERITTGSALAARIRSASQAHAQPDGPPPVLDAGMMQALGSRKLTMYQEKPTVNEARPLAGSAGYSDGAVLGMTSFSVATAVVSSVGLTGALLFYFKPGIVDHMRNGTRRFSQWIDMSLGERLRAKSAIWRDRGILSEERQEKLGSLLAGAVGLRRSGDRIKEEERDIDLVADIFGNE